MTPPDAGRPPVGLGAPRKPASPSLRPWLPPMIYGALIFIQSALPTPGGLPDFDQSDKLMHFLGYALLGGLVCRAFLATWPDRSIGSILLASVIATLVYGITDECHQAFVAARTADVVDVAADGLGGFAGALVLAVLKRRRTAPNRGLTKEGTSVRKRFGIF